MKCYHRNTLFLKKKKEGLKLSDNTYKVVKKYTS